MLQGRKLGKKEKGALRLPFNYSCAVTTVHPVGTALAPVSVQVADAFFTNVPVDATLINQLVVYAVPGVVVNIALT